MAKTDRTLKILTYNYSLSLVFCLAIVLLGQSQVGQTVTGPVSNAVRPLVVYLTTLRERLALQPSAFGARLAAASRVNDLQKQNDQLLVQVAKLQVLEQENTALRQELGIQTKPTISRMIGRLIATNESAVVVLEEPASLPTGTLITSQNNFIGIIGQQKSSQVYTVILTTSPQFKAKVKILHNGTQIDGIASGQYGTTVRVSQVLTRETVAIGDPVVLYDQTLVDPEKALVLGKVSQISRNETEVFQAVTVTPLVDIYTNQTVFMHKL